MAKPTAKILGMEGDMDAAFFECMRAAKELDKEVRRELKGEFSDAYHGGWDLFLEKAREYFDVV
jgi:hypothetical protein